jgi:hypothetical protein
MLSIFQNPETAKAFQKRKGTLLLTLFLASAALMAAGAALHVAGNHTPETLTQIIAIELLAFAGLAGSSFGLRRQYRVLVLLLGAANLGVLWQTMEQLLPQLH